MSKKKLFSNPIVSSDSFENSPTSDVKLDNYDLPEEQQETENTSDLFQTEPIEQENQTSTNTYEEPAKLDDSYDDFEYINDETASSKHPSYEDEPKKSHFKVIIIGLLVILIVGCLAWMGFNLYSSNQKKNTVNNTTIENNVTIPEQKPNTSTTKQNENQYEDTNYDETYNNEGNNTDNNQSNTQTPDNQQTQIPESQEPAETVPSDDNTYQEIFEQTDETTTTETNEPTTQSTDTTTQSN